jgi:hypothetical protein
MRYFLLVKGPYHEQANIFFGCVTKVKDRFGAQLDLPHFENQKKKRRERSPLSHSAEAVNLDLSFICCHALF